VGQKIKFRISDKLSSVSFGLYAYNQKETEITVPAKNAGITIVMIAIIVLSNTHMQRKRTRLLRRALRAVDWKYFLISAEYIGLINTGSDTARCLPVEATANARAWVLYLAYEAS
jgi:hypothetical protein